MNVVDQHSIIILNTFSNLATDVPDHRPIALMPALSMTVLMVDISDHQINSINQNNIQ